MLRASRSLRRGLHIGDVIADEDGMFVRVFRQTYKQCENWHNRDAPRLVPASVTPTRVTLRGLD